MSLPFKLGRKFAPPMPNALRLKNYWGVALTPPPPAFDVDASVLALTGITIAPAMDCNNALECCVAASQVKALRRYFALEWGRQINIVDSDTKAYYEAQTGGADDGLIPDDSYEYWATNGIAVASTNSSHKILTRARVDVTDALDVQMAIFKLGGIGVGGMIPEAWEFTNTWDLEPTSPIVGGHMVFIHGYDGVADTYTGESWGKIVIITGRAFRQCFAEANQGEALAYVRGNESANPVDGLDTGSLTADFNQIKEAA